jgi:hypothetical protein
MDEEERRVEHPQRSSFAQKTSTSWKAKGGPFHPTNLRHSKAISTRKNLFPFNGQEWMDVPGA